MTVTTTPCTRPLPKPFETSSINFGAEISGLDIENLSDNDFELLRVALYKHNVLVIKNQHRLSPRAQCELTRRFDPDADVYSHGKTIDKRSVLHKDLTTIPHQPQVQVIGHGQIESYEGLTNLKLKHPHHRVFHKHPVPEADDFHKTHFYRWHIDSAMYDLDPPLVTSLLAIRVPTGRRQLCTYDDGTGDEMEVPLGTTAFFSGYQMYDLLSEKDKEFARTSQVEYAAHPYIWMANARSRSNGLGLYCDGLELADDQLPPVEPHKIKRYPMVWKNPVTGQLAMMVYPTPARRIHLQDGSVIDDLAEVRQTLYRMQRPAISPQFIYPHDWEEGDLVLFNNHGVMHSIVGAFADHEVRLFRQCNMAASRPPLGPD
ncbi:hypothetical protein A1O3_04881 [Capronia epimyces CBS 606.96]|uniref:TauD/TfdA-like domain-containing protein n=1 Tax=Capronia epimyces CBS 606.96 TaxID=1182542 RepID=W9YPM0_9EURO|nr:uncharacterized protein A1O3_04881 [Capronia epimyces CBS 606.96]EXJ84214.1 hypothetical protein A1O3_04881 [Capronia epimyces CBS 606.96]